MFNFRNMASSVANFVYSAKQVVWTKWTLQKAVQEGYGKSGWVYKCVSIIARNASSVPFVVKDKDNKIVWDHPITKLLMAPHPHLSSIQVYELMIQWLELAGNGYWKIVKDSRGQPAELWPISPDKIKPVESEKDNIFLAGYATARKGGNFEIDTSGNFEIEDIIHLKYMNPAQPLLGISPLQVAAKAVDLDIAQQEWNTSAMQNRGVVEGVFSFKQPIDEPTAKSLTARIMARITGKNIKKPLVLGSEATYTRMSLTSTEMDFLNSRKMNRDEVFAIYSVPPQLGGSQESSTYNNFSESLRILWESRLIYIIKLISTQLNISLAKYLEKGYYISYDLSDVAALKDNEESKAKTAKMYSEMGIPVKQINDKFELGFEEYPGWNMSMQKDATKVETRGLKLLPPEQRNTDFEFGLRDKLIKDMAAPRLTSLLFRQQAEVLKALEQDTDATEAVKLFTEETRLLLRDVYLITASNFANTVVTVRSGRPLNFQRRSELEDEMIQRYLEEEQVILESASAIEQSTIDTILDQVRNASEQGYNYEQLRQALDDTGIFSPVRALRIARTEVGTAGSIGQITSATMAGAKKKRWETAGTETRESHLAREGEEVPIENRFTKQISSVGPRYPLDPQLSPADRVNCDCFMSFTI